jgi:hypothetical protein
VFITQAQLSRLAEESVANFAKLKRNKFSFRFVSSCTVARSHPSLPTFSPRWTNVLLYNIAPSSASLASSPYWHEILPWGIRNRFGTASQAVVTRAKLTPTRCRELHVVSNPDHSNPRSGQWHSSLFTSSRENYQYGIWLLLGRPGFEPDRTRIFPFITEAHSTPEPIGTGDFLPAL